MTDQDDGFGGYYDSFLEGITPGSKVSSGGIFRYRQGGDPRDWSAAGGSKYLPGDWQMQAGCIKWTGAAAASGMVEITFPTPFADSPIVLCTVTNTNPGFERCVVQPTIAAPSLLEVYWWSDNNLTRVDIFWLALGSIGL